MKLTQEVGEVRTAGEVVHTGRYLLGRERKQMSCGHWGDAQATMPMSAAMPDLAQLNQDGLSIAKLAMQDALRRMAETSRCQACARAERLEELERGKCAL